MTAIMQHLSAWLLDPLPASCERRPCGRSV